MSTCNVEVAYPPKACMVEQNEAYFDLVTGSGRERIRIHEYDRVFDVPGLYEEVVYNKLQCDSPNVITDLLKESMQAHAESGIPLRVLDFGAGNGIVGEYLQEALETETIVGVDIIDEAKKAVQRDRPDIYDDYYVMDLSDVDDRDRHTFKHFKTSLFHPELSDRSRHEHWEANGSKDMQQRCNEKARRILADHPVVPKSVAVMEGIEEILDRPEALGN